MKKTHPSLRTVDDLECCIISVGEPTLLDCARSVLAQIYLPAHRYAIFNVSPLNESINAYHRKMRKKFSVKVDADFILHEDCFERLYETILEKGDGYYCVSGLVEDPFFGPIGGIHLYRTEYVKDFVVPDRIGCDRFLDAEMRSRGYRFHEIQTVLAEHSVNGNWENVFARYFRSGQKHTHYGTHRHEDYVKNMGRKWMEGNKMAFVALISYCHGLLSPNDKEKGLNFAEKEIAMMKSLIKKGTVPFE